MDIRIQFLIIIFLSISAHVSYQFENVYIQNGGYKAVFCFNYSENTITARIKEHNKTISCLREQFPCYNNYTSFSCYLYYGFKDQKFIKKKSLEIKKEDNLNFKSLTKTYFNDNENLSIINEKKYYLSLFYPGEIKVKFSNDSVKCRHLEIVKETIICTLQLSEKHFWYQKINVSVKITYGNATENKAIDLGFIIVANNKIYLLILIPILVISIFAIVSITIYIKYFKKKTIESVTNQNEKENIEKEKKYIKMHKLAFLEYNTTIYSFYNLGKLSSHHVLTFYDFGSRVLNIELQQNTNNDTNEEFESFKVKLLNKSTLLPWIKKVQETSRSQERSLVASLLTLVLFQHPKYFLEIIKSLLLDVLTRMILTSEEKILFRRSDEIVEKMVGNWISLCMYKSIKCGEIGKIFFNLYRALKCKIESGLVDMYTKKTKFGLSYDQLFVGILDYEVFQINADVDVEIATKNFTKPSIRITLKDLKVEVLSVDSISQVKNKVIDKAIMEFDYSEYNNQDSDFIIDQIDNSGFQLYFIHSTSSLLLEDFDNTSITPKIEQECIIVNTLKHYNLKTGTKLLLVTNFDSATIKDAFKTNTNKIHIQSTFDFTSTIQDEKKNKNYVILQKPIFNTVTDDSNNEARNMYLLSTKKSISPFLDEFFQSLTNCKNTISKCSNETIDNSSPSNTTQISKDLYLFPIYYLFSMLDDIAHSLLITDDATIQLWKNNSFILRFWINIIKNPNFIFSIDKPEYIDQSLTTIASVLMESCSLGQLNVDLNSPIVKQLFLDDVNNKYSRWWRSFVGSAVKIGEESMIPIMMDIIEENQMKNHYNNSIKSLLTISNKLSI